MISVTIDGNAVYPEVGIVIGEDKTEVFDFGTMDLKNTTRATIYPFGLDVVVTVDGTPYRYIVETDKKTQVSETLYDHFITLTEHTAILTKEVGADRIFTVKSNGDSYTSKEMTEILRDTVPFAKTELFGITTGTATALDFNARQTKIQGLNLYESLKTVFKNIKAVPRLLWVRSLVHTKYNEKGNLITLADLTSNNLDAKANSYGNTIITKASNMVYDGGVAGSNVSSVYFPSKTGAVTPRSSSGDFDDVNSEYQLNFDIRNIYETTLTNVITNTLGTVSLDISPSVLSKEAFDKLAVGDSAFPTTVEQSGAIYYTKGDNKVVDMGTTYTFSLTAGSFSSMTQLVIFNLDRKYGTGTALTEYVAQPIQDYEMRFRYEPFVDIDISRERWDNDIDKRGMILSNQRDTIIDMDRYGGLLGDQAQRLSNGNWIVTVDLDNLAQKKELGDYTADNYQIIRASYELYNSRVIAYYELAKNWATVDGDQSVNRKAQPYTLGKETVQSNFRYTEYMEFSFTQRTHTGNLTAQGIATYLNLYKYLAGDNLGVHMAQYTNSDSNQGASAITIPCLSAGGEGINFVMNFLDPILAGNQKTDPGGTAKQKLNPIRYTDVAGAVDTASYKLVNDVTVNSEDFPLTVYESTTLYELNNKYFALDPNGIQGLNIELLPSTDLPDDIIVGAANTTFNNLVGDLTSALDTDLHIYTYDPSFKLDMQMIEIPTGYLSDTQNSFGEIVVNKTTGYIDVDLVPNTGTRTWAIGIFGRLLCAVNYTGQARTRLYTNNLKEKTNINNI